MQFVRFIPEARARAGQVILECQPPLKRLFEHARCADKVIAVGETLPPFDYYVPVMSLPLVLGTTLETIPANPCLVAPAAEALPPVPSGHLKVGLAWAGSPGNTNDARRSIPFLELQPILAQPGIAFFGLQVPIRPRDQAACPRHPATRAVDRAAQGLLRHRRLHWANGPRPLRGYRRRPPRGRARETRLGPDPPPWGLALAAPAHRFPLVPNHALVPPVPIRPMATGHRSGGGRTGSLGGGPEDARACRLDESQAATTFTSFFGTTMIFFTVLPARKG